MVMKDWSTDHTCQLIYWLWSFASFHTQMKGAPLMMMMKVKMVHWFGTNPPLTPLPCGTALPVFAGVGQNTLPVEGLIGVAPLWCTWPKQLNSGPRPPVCHYDIGDKAASRASLFILMSTEECACQRDYTNSAGDF